MEYLFSLLPVSMENVEGEKLELKTEKCGTPHCAVCCRCDDCVERWKRQRMWREKA